MLVGGMRPGLFRDRGDREGCIIFWRCSWSQRSWWREEDELVERRSRLEVENLRKR